jgi:hypothetical protein
VVEPIDDKSLSGGVEPICGNISWSQLFFILRLGWVLFDIFKDSGRCILELGKRKW